MALIVTVTLSHLAFHGAMDAELSGRGWCLFCRASISLGSAGSWWFFQEMQMPLAPVTRDEQLMTLWWLLSCRGWDQGYSQLGNWHWSWALHPRQIRTWVGQLPINAGTSNTQNPQIIKPESKIDLCLACLVYPGLVMNNLAFPRLNRLYLASLFCL